MLSRNVKTQSSNQLDTWKGRTNGQLVTKKESADFVHRLFRGMWWLLCDLGCFHVRESLINQMWSETAHQLLLGWTVVLQFVSICFTMQLWSPAYSVCILYVWCSLAVTTFAPGSLMKSEFISDFLTSTHLSELVREFRYKHSWVGLMNWGEKRWGEKAGTISQSRKAFCLRNGCRRRGKKVIRKESLFYGCNFLLMHFLLFFFRSSWCERVFSMTRVACLFVSCFVFVFSASPLFLSVSYSLFTDFCVCLQVHREEEGRNT